MKTGTFVSDLHQLASRSQTERYADQVLSAAQASDLLVLGGDIFDFRWSTLASIDDSIHKATNWVKRLLEEAPDCDVVYVLGNHDYHEDFIEQLEQLATACNRFECERFHYRLGDCIFLHGDAGDGYVTEESLSDHRSRWDSNRINGAWQSSAYDLATKLCVHVPIVAGAHPHRRTCRRIAKYLGNIDQNGKQGIRRVFFGHTHRVVRAFEYEGLTFFNGGAPMKGLTFDMFRFHIDLQLASV